jgi:hypothetical protein
LILIRGAVVVSPTPGNSSSKAAERDITDYRSIHSDRQVIVGDPGSMTIALSAAALAVSLSSFLATFLATHRRDKRDLLLRMHERLTTADQQRGRRLLYQMSESGRQVEDMSDDEYELVNNSLASLNTLGVYYQRRYVPRPALLELYAETVLRLMRPAGPFLAHRDALRGRPQWPQLYFLAEESREYLRERGIDSAVVEASGRTQAGFPDDPGLGM